RAFNGLREHPAPASTRPQPPRHRRTRAPSEEAPERKVNNLRKPLTVVEDEIGPWKPTTTMGRDVNRRGRRLLLLAPCAVGRDGWGDRGAGPQPAVQPTVRSPRGRRRWRWRGGRWPRDRYRQAGPSGWTVRLR